MSTDFTKQECCLPSTYGYVSSEAKDAVNENLASSDPDCVPAIGGFTPNLGPSDGGTAVKIVGVCLDNVTEVQLDGLALSSFEVLDSQHLQGVTPKHAAGVVDATFVTDAGDIDVTNAFTYTPAPPIPPNTNCTFTLSPVGAAFGAGGGAGNTIDVTTQAGCAWTAVSNASWITITAGASGVGSGTVTYTVDVNAADTRAGFITVANRNFPVTQAGTPPIPPVVVCDASCSYSLTPMVPDYFGPYPGRYFPREGGTGTITVTASANNCAWSATNTNKWITLIGSTTGTGSGSISYSVAENVSVERIGYITVCDQQFKVIQAPNPYPLHEPPPDDQNSPRCSTSDITVLRFERVCETGDFAGEWGEFGPNGNPSDYHWKLQLQLAAGLTIRRITVRITNSAGKPNASEVWDTQSVNIFPLVLFDAGGQINYQYTADLALVGPTLNLEMYGQERLPVETEEQYFTVYIYTSKGCVATNTVLGVCPAPLLCPIGIPNPLGTKFRISDMPTLTGDFPSYLDFPLDPCRSVPGAGGVPYDGVMEETGFNACSWSALQHWQNTRGAFSAPCSYSTFIVATDDGQRQLAEASIQLIAPGTWQLDISLVVDPVGCVSQNVWTGQKTTGLTPAGTYNVTAMVCATGPASMLVLSV